MPGNGDTGISVVIPTCNRPDDVIRSVQSVLDNEYSPFEVIVVDQSADDRTERMLTDRFGKLHHVRYQHLDVSSSSISRNKGWEAASYAIVAFTDDDALVSKHWLKSIAEIFQHSQPVPGLVGGPIEPVFESPRPEWLPGELDYLLPSFHMGEKIVPFPDSALPISVNIASTRMVLEEVGGFNPELGLRAGSKYPFIGGEDSFLGMAVKRAGHPIIYTPGMLVYHPVPRKRLNRRFFYHRNFREGVTTIELENASGVLDRKNIQAHFRWHLLRILKLLLEYPIIFLKGNDPWTRSSARQFAKVSFSWGVVYWCVHLMKTGHRGG